MKFVIPTTNLEFMIMEQYVVYVEDLFLPQEVRSYRFENLELAKKEAKRLCETRNKNVQVVRVIGFYTQDIRWIDNGVPNAS